MLKNLLKTKKQKLRQEYEDKAKEIPIQMIGEPLAIAWLNLKVKSEGLDSLAYELMCELAEEGKDNAIFCLNTRDNEKSQRIVLDLLQENKRYARNRVHRAYHENEPWVDEFLTWNKNPQNEVNLIPKKDANNAISFIEAVNEGNPLAVEKYSSQFSDSESTERLNIIKSILCLHDDRYSTTLISTNSEILPFHENYNFKPVLPELEKKLFNQLHLALQENPKLARERLQLAQCYKLGIGVEQNLIKSINNLLIYEWTEGGSWGLYNELRGFATGLNEVTLPQIKISKSDLHDVQMYPNTSEVFLSEQSWLEKHFMPIMRVDLGMLKAEWKDINLPICLAYEPESSSGYRIGETTKDHHNDYTCVGWYAFRLTENNQYEFLGDENFFHFASHEDTKDIIETRDDFQECKEKYLKTGDFFHERFRDGKTVLEPIDDVYLELGGSNYGHDFRYTAPEFFCHIPGCGVASIENKPMYHIASFEETTMFAEYYRVGSVGIFFEPDSRTVLYSCKHVRTC